jgi:hypothetical protein
MRPGDTFRGMAHFFSSTGALADADDLPVGVLRRNGVTLAGAAVIITRVGTGTYTWSVLLDENDGWVPGDTAIVEISGAVGGISMSQSISAVIGEALVQASAYTAERAALLDNLARLDVAVSSRLAASAYTAPDNASIAQAAADAATVASRLTATRAAHLDAPISGIPAAVWSHAQRTLTDLGLTGLGANPVVVHVQDDAGAPLLGQMVTVLDAAGTHVIAVAITDAKGAATLNLPTGEVLLAALSSISHVAPEPVSYEVVPGAQDGPTITLSARFVAVAPEPGLCMVYGRLITGDGKPVVGATARAELRDTVPVAEGNLLSRASVMSEPSDADGVFRMLLLASKAYRVLFDADRQWRDVVVPAEPALDLGTLPAR